MKKIKVRITFTEEILGTASGDPKLHEEFVASKAPNAQSMEEEVAALGVDEVVRNGMTVFPRDDQGRPFLYDYQLKGFFKDACSMLSRCGGKDSSGKKAEVNESSKIKAYKKIIDGLIFVNPRRIPFVFDGQVGSCQRPLRAQTAQGERIAIANSETVPAGAYIDVEIVLLNSEYEAAVIEWLDYGALRGIGCWRNASKGRFEYQILD
jgi:hypothetical protein